MSTWKVPPLLFPFPLSPGRFLGRRKRFFADIALDTGETVVAHCPNSGAMTGLDTPGMPAWVSPAPPGGKRKLAWTLEILQADGALVGLNTLLPNRLVAEAWSEGRLPPLAAYTALRREVTAAPGTRLDFLAEGPGLPPCWLEVKNVHLRRCRRGSGTAAEFPDCPTARGARHLQVLAALRQTGARAMLLYLVQRQDCTHFEIAGDIDPVYARACAAAQAAGVEMAAFACSVTLSGIRLDQAMPLGLS